MSDLIQHLIQDWRQQRPDLDASAMGVTGRILRLAQRYEEQANKVLKPFNLRYSELDVLATLRRKGKPFQLNPKQLMESVLLTSGAMTACLDRLEKRKLIKRIADPDDRRGRIIQLTKEGLSMVDKAIEARFEQAHASVNTLSGDEIASLSVLLQRLAIEIESGN